MYINIVYSLKCLLFNFVLADSKETSKTELNLLYLHLSKKHLSQSNARLKDQMAFLVRVFERSPRAIYRKLRQSTYSSSSVANTHVQLTNCKTDVSVVKLKDLPLSIASCSDNSILRKLAELPFYPYTARSIRKSRVSYTASRAHRQTTDGRASRQYRKLLSASLKRKDVKEVRWRYSARHRYKVGNTWFSWSVLTNVKRNTCRFASLEKPAEDFPRVLTRCSVSVEYVNDREEYWKCSIERDYRKNAGLLRRSTRPRLKIFLIKLQTIFHEIPTFLCDIILPSFRD